MMSNGSWDPITQHILRQKSRSGVGAPERDTG